MNEPLNENNFVRLARALMEKHRISYDQAMLRLASLKLRIVCNREQMGIAAYQAALLTAVNTGCRSFLGGVHVDLPEAIPLRLPWPNRGSLGEAVLDLGGEPGDGKGDCDVTVVLGPGSSSWPDAIRALCDGWRGGVLPIDVETTGFLPGEDFAIGGVLAGGLAVHHAFMNACGLAQHLPDRVTGMSLWRPDIDWFDARACGPRLSSLPKRLWVIGLGHLGQAYLWSLGLLPYQTPSEAVFMLQDFDRVASANWVAGLICRKHDAGRYKTRVLAGWLEARGFETVITERPYDKHTIRTDEEPFVALCGVDVTPARRLLENGGFDLVVECGVGSTTGDFDRLKIHTFPGAARTPEQVWPVEQGALAGREPSKQIIDSLMGQEDCGVLASALENKSISASFVGAAAGAMVVGEILRAAHGGCRLEFLHVQLRGLHNCRSLLNADGYRAEMARTGLVAARGPEEMTPLEGYYAPTPQEYAPALADRGGMAS